ncbi:MAG: (2Fe-2S) ferredoxin domain-containing protein [Mariprofundaceae bacterium]|nr:(2Fe-2S) ferredoxin domain-containing protein [Mariprofundaceae bacterium]
MSEKPSIETYKHHVLMCTGKSCGENMPLLKSLKAKVQQAGLEHDIRVNRAGCLGVCEQGPIMVVHPEGVWYYDLTEEKLDHIVEEHFKQDKPVSDFTFHGTD